MPKHKANKPSDTTASDDTQRVETAVSGRISLSDSLSLLSNHQEDEMAKSETFQLPGVSEAQLEACRVRIKTRITQAIRESDYFANPGALSGYLSDLRALDYIEPEVSLDDIRAKVLKDVAA